MGCRRQSSHDRSHVHATDSEQILKRCRCLQDPPFIAFLPWNPNMCVYGCVYAQHKKESARGCRNPGSNLLVWNKYIDIDLEPKLCPLHTLGHPFMQKPLKILSPVSCHQSSLPRTSLRSLPVGGGLHHSDQLTLQIWKNRGDIEIYWMSKKTGKGPTQMAPRHKQRKDTPKEMQTTTTCSSISQTRHVTSSRFLMLS